MKWNLIKETPTNRVYRQDTTGSETETYLIYQDQAGRNWWGFRDLFKIPYLRIAFSKSIADLFNAGVTHEDLEKWDNEEISILKSNDHEKYEKLYSLILQRRKARQSVADPLKQHLALATIYVLYPEERIDYFEMPVIEQKMKDWAIDPEAVGFFLNWHIGNITPYINSLNTISKIALNPKN